MCENTCDVYIFSQIREQIDEWKNWNSTTRNYLDTIFKLYFKK